MNTVENNKERKIDINDKYRIVVLDRYSVCPEEKQLVRSRRKDLKENENKYRWYRLGYFPNITSALLGILDNEGKDVVIKNEGLTVREFIGELDRVKSEIIQASKKFEKEEVHHETT